MSSIKPETKDGVRYFTCKRCGQRNAEPVRSWRKKPQQYKNICQLCLDRQATAAQDARERAYLYGHKYF